MDFGTQIGVAGLGLAAFSTTVDLIRASSKTYEAYMTLNNVDEDITLLQNRLILQKDLLEHWKRDWYGLAVTDHASIGRLRLLKQHDRAVQAALQSVHILLKKMQPLAQYASSGTLPTAVDSLKWVATQKVASAEAITAADALLDGLYKILPPRSPDITIALMISAMDRSITSPTLLSTNHALGQENASQVIQRTLGLRNLQESLIEDLKRRVLEHQNSIPLVDLQIRPSSRVDRGQVDQNSFGSRNFGFFDNKPVVIEWKSYDANWQGTQGIELRGRIDNIARLLWADSKPEELLVLHCEGYYDDVENSRFGFIFAFPGSDHGRILSLKELIDVPGPDRIPTLEQRYQIAYSLSLTLTILHTADWLHKSIRSHNVLFYQDGDQITWARPYLMGFEYSRPDKPDASSEKPALSASFNLYRHPLSQGSPQESYRKQFDIYSFGILLFEIGMWRTARKWWADGLTAGQFRSKILEDINSKKLAHLMGVEYRDATWKCLNGDLESRDTSLGKAFVVEVVEVLGRCSIGGL